MVINWIASCLNVTHCQVISFSVVKLLAVGEILGRTLRLVSFTRDICRFIYQCLIDGHWLVFTRDSCTGRYCWQRVLATGILSVRLSVTTQYGFKARWDRDSGSSPYDSLVSSFLWGNLVPLGEEIPLKRGHQRGVPPLDTVILPLLVHLAWKWLQIDTDLLLIITRTANELSSGTNIDDLEWPWTPKIGVLSDFLLF